MMAEESASSPSAGIAQVERVVSIFNHRADDLGVEGRERLGLVGDLDLRATA